jgi:mRNA interferase MazF
VIWIGDVARRDLVGPSASSLRIGARIQKTHSSVQDDPINRSRIATVVCVPLTSNLKWAGAPGNVLLDTHTTGLPKDSVANVSQIVTLDRSLLTELVSKLSPAKTSLVIGGINVILGQ